MKKTYVSIFWVVLSAIVIFNEVVLTYGLQVLTETKWLSWLLIAVWSLIGIKNIYSFLNQKAIH